MATFAQSILRKLVRDTRGAEIAEAAAVLPLMFMMLLGIFWFGQAFRIYGTITRAAQEGARAAAAPLCTTCGGSANPGVNAAAAVQNVLSSAKLDPTKAAWPKTVPSLLACRNAAAVSCDPSQGKICVQEEVELSVRAGGGVGVCGTSVSFKYPFQFWLPFTSLNKQQIQLVASARVRSEAH
jgi:Flp pilus assembly protein TadG